MRVGAILLTMAFLSIVITYLIFQRAWIQPLSRKYDNIDALVTAIEDLRVAYQKEMFARASSPEASAAITAAAESTNAKLHSVREKAIWVDAARDDAHPAISAQISAVENEIGRWRDAVRLSPSAVANTKISETLEQHRDAVHTWVRDLNVKLDNYIDLRTTVLIIVGAFGGLATWIASSLAIRRSRNSLRGVSDHITAIEAGELAPRSLDSFVEIREVNTCLNRLGVALAKSREDADRERALAGARQAELEQSHEFVLEMTHAQTEGEVVRAFYKHATRAFGVESVEILRFVNPPGILEELPNAPENTNKKIRIIEDPNLCIAFRSSETSPRGPELSDFPASLCPASPCPERATLCVPMRTAYGKVGVVHICAEKGKTLDAIPRAVVETFVRLFAPVLENARLLRESQERGATDPLTGLANRRRLEEFGSKQIALAIRQNTPLAVVALDLDKFKNINDEFGHEVGDRALIAVAQAMQSAIRETDIASRLGGDEFALVLPGSAGAAAVRVIERIRASLARPMSKHFPVALHVSAGIAEVSPRVRTLAELLALADRALYDAKRHQRGIGHARPEAVEDEA